MIRRSLLSDQVLVEIISRIKSGMYKPGERLPSEQELTREFQVSRNCVREAIRCLVAGGVVSSRAGKGTFVAPHAKEIVDSSNFVVDFGEYVSALDLIEVRLMIEPEAAALAASRATPEQLQEFGKVMKRLEEKMEMNLSWQEEGLEFHNFVAEMTGNRVLTKIMASISEELFRIRSYLYRRNLRVKEMLDEHRAIYLAITSREEKKAMTAMRRHIENMRNSLRA